MAVRYIPPSKNVGDSVHDINYNFDYLDTHIEDVLQAAEDYADGRDAEFLAVSADYAEEKALQAQQAAQAYADSLVYIHPAYTARDINKVSGTQQITPGTPFTLAWFSVDNTGHVYQSGSSYFNIEPYVHPTYAEKDIGRETGVKQLTPGTTFTLPWVHVDAMGHVNQHGISNYNITPYTSLKNPYAITIQGNGTTLTNGTYDGSEAKTVNITPSSIGALSLSGGILTGDVVIPLAKATRNDSLPASGSSISVTDVTDLKNYKSFIGSYRQSNIWFNLINVRHRNGYGDGIDFGMYMKSGLITAGDLIWNKQYGSDLWQGERTILDSENYTSYTVTKTGSGAAGSWGINVTGSSGSCAGNADTATKLQTPRTIDGVEFDGTANISHYAVCSTAAATVAKVVSCPGFTLITGAVIHIKFAIWNSANNITLNVNGTGAKPVYQFNTAMTAANMIFYKGMVYTFVYDGTAYQCVNDQRYVWQQNTTTNANYRLSLAYTACDESETSYVRKSSKFTANPATGVLTAEEFKHSASGTLLADTSANADSVSITNAEIAKYSQLYMSASWTEQETVNFCDIVPIADIIAGAVFTKIIATGTRRYTYTVTCTSAGLFTLTQSNSTSTAGTLRLKLYVI